MLRYLIKLAITAVLIVAISEVSKRSTLFASILASIPLVSVLALIWLYLDTQDNAQVASLATGIFWLVLPSLIFFLLLPLMLRWGYSFYPSLSASLSVTVVCYFGMVLLLVHGDA